MILLLGEDRWTSKEEDVGDWLVCVCGRDILVKVLDNTAETLSNEDVHINMGA